ncbi:Hsp20 family protein [Haloferula sp. BvORR071]|uniref:Hsp20/alpha crystallin family protein n=1 Tax=Haloferula sp. BvORR071 TaxID=1396141 RepID=UPI002240FACB|nr:Hsp20 family protein [Haloferula sp. BvORR071]
MDRKKGTCVVAGAIAVGAGAVVLTAPLLRADEGKGQGVLEKIQDWQNVMSDKFRDTWKSFRKRGTPSVVSASIDLREQEKNYMLRLDLPGRDLEKVEVTLKGDVLHIVVPEGGHLGRYEQSVVLGGVLVGAEPVIERKKEDGVITVTLPKGSEKTAPPYLRAVPAAPLLTPSKWERDVLRQMDDLQKEMDEIFQSAFGKVSGSPELLDYFDQPRFGAFIDVKEEGSNYVVTAYLPERDVSNAKTSIEGRILKIEASAEDTPSKANDGETASVTRRAYYSQQLTLPGPVKADKVTVERKEGLLKVVVPKEG